MRRKPNGTARDSRNIETDVAWLMKDVESAKLIILGENLSHYGLHVGQPRLMHLIKVNPGSTQNQIAKLLRVSASSLSMSIKRLEKQGLVNRVTPDNDQRRNELYLTDEGERVSKACKEVVLDMHDHLLLGFDELEKEKLRSYLIRMMENAEAHPLYTRGKHVHDIHRGKPAIEEEPLKADAQEKNKRVVETETVHD